MAISLPSFAWQPTKTVDLIVGFPPGGSTDRVARVLVYGLEKHGLNVQIKNLPGAGGVISYRHVNTSNSDGHTLLLTGTSLMFSKLLNAPGTDYDILKGFTHLNAIGTVTNGIWSNPDKVKTDLNGIINDEQTGKKKYKWAVTNPGAKFTVLMLNSKLSNPVKLVEYKGSSPAVKDLLGGHVDIVVDSGSSVLSEFETKGQVVYQGSTSPKESDSKSIENIVSGVVSFSFFGVSLPPNTDKSVVKFYTDKIQSVLNDKEIIDKIKQLGLSPANNINVGDIIKKQSETYAPIAKSIAK